MYGLIFNVNFQHWWFLETRLVFQRGEKMLNTESLILNFARRNCHVPRCRSWHPDEPRPTPRRGTILSRLATGRRFTPPFFCRSLSSRLGLYTRYRIGSMSRTGASSPSTPSWFPCVRTVCFFLIIFVLCRQHTHESHLVAVCAKPRIQLFWTPVRY